MIDWVVVGGESGPGARPCDVGWIRSVVRQCREASVPVFVKQVGARPMCRRDRTNDWSSGETPESEWPDGTLFGSAPGHMGTQWQARLAKLRDRRGGDPSEWPEDLRWRQFPEVTRG